SRIARDGRTRRRPIACARGGSNLRTRFQIHCETMIHRDGVALITKAEWGESRRAWCVLFLITILLRLSASLISPHLGGVYGTPNGSDGLVAQGSDGYEKIAANVLNGHGYRIRPDLAPTMLRNPGYIGLLVAVFTLFGQHRIVGQIVQCVIAGTILLLIRRIGRPVAGARTTFLAGILYAFYPIDWIACTR